jgi:GTPase SAR1 family protein
MNCLILGKCGSGKSSILWSLLNEGYTYKNKRGKAKSIFDEAVFFVGTKDAVSSFERLPIKLKSIQEDFDALEFEEYCNDLAAHQMLRLSEGKPCLNGLIVFDDFAGTNVLRKTAANKAPPLAKLVISSRHELNTSVIYLSQVYKGCGFTSPTVRNNVTTFIISKMSRAEIEKIAEELSGDYDPREWIDIYDSIMAKQPYNFVVLDTRRPVDAQWTERFDVPFPPSQKALKYSAAT